MSEAHLLLVDDDPELSQLLQQYLAYEGYEITLAASAEAAEQQLNQGLKPDLLLLDIGLPGCSGLEWLQSLRPRCTLPVIMLTARGDDIDRILGLEMGADDYLPKPCNPRELLARIRALLRRVRQPENKAQALQSQGILLDPSSHSACLDDQALNLTSAEFYVLYYLMQQAGQAVSRDTLTQKVLHRPLTAYDRAIDVHVSRVRQKLSSLRPQAGDLIKTLRGQGYLFVNTP